MRRLTFVYFLYLAPLGHADSGSYAAVHRRAMQKVQNQLGTARADLRQLVMSSATVLDMSVGNARAEYSGRR